MPQDSVYTRAAAELARRRRAAEDAAAAFREELYSSLPQLRRFDGEAAEICRHMTSAALEGDTARVEKQRLALQELTARRSAFLQQADIDEELLRPQYTCHYCRDTGYTAEGKRCRCFTRLLQEGAADSLPAGVLSACGGFEEFDLTYYSDKEENGRIPRETMKDILARCRDYAASFSRKSGNLLFYGCTGLGKTFLSVAIAREVLKKGFSVQYVSAQALIDCFERVRFSRNATADDQEVTRSILTCDLLILDDLGSEAVNSFSQSVLYQVINDRLTEGRATVISTNLNPTGFKKTYNERIVSRLIGSYTLLGFVGCDIRIQKRMREMGGR